MTFITKSQLAAMPLPVLEAKAAELERLAMRESGMPNYPSIHNRRCRVLTEIERRRPLTRWEYINLYDYQIWCDLCDDHGVPETHPVDPSRESEAVQLVSAKPV